jgi:hypothetical protein
MPLLNSTTNYNGGYTPPNATAGTFTYLWEVRLTDGVTSAGGAATVNSPNTQNTSITWNGLGQYRVYLTVTQSGVSCGTTISNFVPEEVTTTTITTTTGGGGCIPITGVTIS